MLRGLTTVSFWADDVIAARDWYADVLGIEPYFQRPEEGPPAYIEFRIGADEDELGLIDRRYAPPGASRDPGGAVIYWQVDDVAAAVARLVEHGATEYQPVTEQGMPDSSPPPSSTRSATFSGLMYNPHFVAMQAR